MILLKPKILKFAIMKNIIVLIISILFLSSCEKMISNDFEVNAPWKDATIVYSLLEANKDTQFVKIYRAFLGEEGGSARELVLISDSIYYDTSSVSVFLSTNPALGSIKLKPIILNDLPEGTFSSSPNLAYFTTEQIDDEIDYDLIIYKNDTITAQTSIVKDNQLFTQSSSSSSINFMSGSTPFDSIISRAIYYYKTPKGVAYSLDAYLLYEESFDNTFTGTVTDSINWNIQTWKNEDISGVSPYTLIFDGEDFFNNISSGIESDVNIFRKAYSLKLVLTVGGQELFDYVEYSRPTFSVLLEKPEFEGNINGGYGVFSSRISKSQLRSIHPDTRERLVSDPRTQNLNFVVN